MALAAARPLHCAAHMGEPTPHSTVITALPDLCPVPQDVANNNGEATSLRPRSTSSLLPDALDAAASSFPPSAVASSVNNYEDGETCSNDKPSKGSPSVTSVSRAHMGVTESFSLEVEVAVREENEDNESQSQGQRQSPSPSTSFQGKRQPLASALKTNDALLPVKKGFRTRRRIRGIWGDDNRSQFSQLHDETLLMIMKCLSMKDLCIASMVCQRWKHLALHQDAWKRIDASDFVEAIHDHYCMTTSPEALTGRPAAPKSTSLVLADRLERHPPQSLVIHSIQHRLSADNFSSSLPSLQELTLTSFDELTDTHIHVLLLSSSCKNVQARSKRSCILRKLVLEHCPKLTNASVQSIGKMCPELEELSLQGSPNITDLTSLKELWYLTKKPIRLAAPVATRPAPPSLSAMAMLFSPPPPATLAAPTPSPPRPSTPTNALQSLFAPPGQSPPRTKNVISILPRTLSSGTNTNEPGKLKLINVSNTGVSAKSLLAGWKTIPAGNYVALQHLLAEGSGASWNDSLLHDLAETLDLSNLQSLNLGCNQKSRITDKGLRSLTHREGSHSLERLKKLNLSGHSCLTGTGLGELITTAAPTLEELILDGCKGLSSKSFNAARDFANCDAFAKAILKCTSREANRRGNDDEMELGWGLRRLSLSRCFSSQAQLQKNTKLQLHEETLGTFVLEAIGQMPKTKKQTKASVVPASFATTATATVGTLTELDLTDCWFVRSSDIASVQERCPGLHRILLNGTRADAER